MDHGRRARPPGGRWSYSASTTVWKASLIWPPSTPTTATMTAAMIAILMVPLLGMGALVIDVAALVQERRELQNGADSAALAVAKAAEPTSPSHLLPDPFHPGLEGLVAEAVGGHRMRTVAARR